MAGWSPLEEESDLKSPVEIAAESVTRVDIRGFLLESQRQVDGWENSSGSMKL